MLKMFLSICLWMEIGTIEIHSMPSYPHPVRIAAGSGFVDIFLHGDENFKYAQTLDGYTVFSVEKEWYYATEDENGKIVPSTFKIKANGNMDSDTKQFLAKTKKGLSPTNNTYRMPHHSITNGNPIIKKSVAIGNRKALIILIQFKDKKFAKDRKDFNRLFNEQNYHEDGAMGSVYDYYKWASYGQLELTSDVLGPYTAQNDMSYYGGNAGVGGNDKNPYALFTEALNHAIQEIKLSDYDADGDGYVDNIHIIYAGYGEEAGAPSYAIWAHEMTFRAITVQGMKVDRYSCAPELRGNRGDGISRIGPHCHEIGHALGAMDYYDTDYETGGNYAGTGKWDIMASGSWNNDGISPADFNPYVKVYDFGWTEAKSLVKDSINAIGVSSEKGNIYRIDTGTSKDYFLLENRNKKDFHSAEPGNGLMIFHVGPDIKTRSSTNTINSTYPQQCYVVCASSTYKKPASTAKSYGDINSAGCPYPGASKNNEFSAASTPAALTVSGKETSISITNIELQDEIIKFYFGNNEAVDPDDNINPGTDPDTSQPVYLWGEDFEQLRLPSSWNYSDIEKNGKVEVVTKLSESDTPQSPIAKNGKGYAKFAGISQQIIGKYRTTGLLISPRINLTEGEKYVLSFSARKYNSDKNAHDSIRISLFDDVENYEQEIVISAVNNQNSWALYSIEIPERFYRFSINIAFSIDYKSIMFIDNITLSEKSQETGMDNHLQQHRKTSKTTVYSLWGTRMQHNRRGINIIRKSDGTVSKVISR